MADNHLLADYSRFLGTGFSEKQMADNHLLADYSRFLGTGLLWNQTRGTALHQNNDFQSLTGMRRDRMIPLVFSLRSRISIIKIHYA